MPDLVTIADLVQELNSIDIVADLTKPDGSAIGPTALDTLTLTLYDVATGGIINAVDHVNIKDTGRGTLSAAGHLVVSLESADNPMVGTAQTELHKALIVGKWNSGKGYTSQEVVWTVVNVNKVP